MDKRNTQKYVESLLKTSGTNWLSNYSLSLLKISPQNWPQMTQKWAKKQMKYTINFKSGFQKCQGTVIIASFFFPD